MNDNPIRVRFAPSGQEVMASVAQGAKVSMLSAEHVLSALAEIGAQNYEIDHQNIDRLLRSSGDREFNVAKKVDGRVDVSVSPDKMEAAVTIIPPRGGAEIDESVINQAVAVAGIRFGIREDVIQNMVAQQWHNEKVTIAEGKPPVDGEDGKIDFLFNTDESGPKPTIADDGSVDYYELNVVQNVKANQPLARKTPPKQGEPGTNVFGQELAPKQGKDVPFPIGKNATFSKDDPNVVIAQIAGQPRMISGKIHVLPIFEVKGNVDFSTGNINFIGDIIIRGGVLEGFVVKAEGDVTIFGPVSGCIVEAGGNVFLNKGMHGQDKGIITAGEDVVARFLEHTTIRAGGNVKATDGIIQCNITAKKNVFVEGKKGVIIGGRISAGEEVRAKVIGNYLATVTEIEAGGSPKVREELRQIEDQKKQIKLNLDRTEKGVKSLKLLQEKQGALPGGKKDLLLQLTRAQYHLMGQLKKLETREEELEEILASSFKGKVTIGEAIYPGTKLIIKQAVLHIRDQINSTVFYEQDGEIQIGVYG